jgi:hypothetical protein
MKLAVGATSRRLVEVAAQCGVHQIVASEAQVNRRGGYTGMTQDDLVWLVHEASRSRGPDARRPQVIRDHGHTLEIMDDDVTAGFDGLHLDVELLDPSLQHTALLDMADRYADVVRWLEIGGEHIARPQNLVLLDNWMEHVGTVPNVFVYNAGTYVWADRQVGDFNVSPAVVLGDLGEVREYQVAMQHGGHVDLKFHNCDWIPWSTIRRYTDSVGYVNVAPELGLLETQLILRHLTTPRRNDVLNHAYASNAWRRWFNDDEGTRDERALCALRYLQWTDDVVAAGTTLSSTGEEVVRGELRAWITARLGA